MSLERNLELDFDFCYSDDPSHLGIIVVVAKKNGVKVCWQCMKPFVRGDRQLGEVEKFDPGATVPYYVHRACFDGSRKLSYVFVERASKAKRMLVGAIKSSLGLEQKAQPVIDTGLELPDRPVDPDWRFERRVAVMKSVVTEGPDGVFTASISDGTCGVHVVETGSTAAEADEKVREKALEALRAREKTAGEAAA